MRQTSIIRQAAKEKGEKTYNTGKPCINDHLSDRYTINGSCVECVNIRKSAYAKKYYEKNRENRLAYVSKYKEENREKVLESKRKSYEKNKEKILERQSEYRKNNLDLVRKRNKDYYYNRSDEQKEKQKIDARSRAIGYYWENPEQYRKRAREYHHKNRDENLEKLTKWKSENPNWNKEYRQLPHVKQKARFFASRRRAFKERAIPLWADLEKIEEIYATLPDGMHVDHIVPLVSKYVCGLHVEHNLRHLDATENHSKGNHHWPDMW